MRYNYNYKYSNIYFEICKFLKCAYFYYIFVCIFNLGVSGQYPYNWLWDPMMPGTKFSSRRRNKIFTGVSPRPITTLTGSWSHVLSRTHWQATDDSP